MTPTVGRIVHLHRFGAPPCAAIITGVISPERVNLVAFEIMTLTFELDVPYDDRGVADRKVPSWTWPPRNEGREP